MRSCARSFWRISCFARRRLPRALVPIRVALRPSRFSMRFTAIRLGLPARRAIRVRRLRPVRICPRRRIAWIATDCRSPKIPESRNWIRRSPPLRHTPGRTSPNCRSTWCSTTGYTRPQACSVRIATVRQVVDPRKTIRWPMCTAATASTCRRALPAIGARQRFQRVSNRRPRTAPRATGSLWIDANS